MLTMSLTAKEDQPCNSKRAFSKGEFVSGMYLVMLPSLLS